MKKSDIELSIDNQTEFKIEFKKELIQIILNLAKYFNIEKHINVDLTIVNNEEIQKLNKEYRGKDYATDILSFDFGNDGLYDTLPFVHLGELVVSYEKVIAQANEFNHSVKREFCYLFTHGLVHLMGYDHEEENERVEMNRIVDEIFNPLNITRED
ncbi:rRNA maturation RNase YbeY [Mycoplasma anserisalpingitidis]|uniref:rRNA maturation RNase YbeY n=1 Tax=Mycoplasma anserisalpingitidis TaxID=519450 RepID=UPI001CF6FC5D|nr:rRNA maturation RNase YbeY [Mycoplasma anserisalpingitidis]UCU26787.1 rRNA maturation RNase YbeY [Mycoplasma anserisalpingitidis]UCU27626.1 rRNA maturation RNase YbeY [Mycoplasma anserisalpingitidis]